MDVDTDRTREAIEKTVEEALSNHHIVIIRGSRDPPPTYGGSRTIIGLVQKFTDDYKVLGTQVGIDIYRDILNDKCGDPTIPQLHVDGEYVGALADVEELYDDGELAGVLGEEAATSPF